MVWGLGFMAWGRERREMRRLHGHDLQRFDPGALVIRLQARDPRHIRRGHDPDLCHEKGTGNPSFSSLASPTDRACFLKTRTGSAAAMLR